MNVTYISCDFEWPFYDISFRTTLRLKQEQRNLVKVLKQLERQRRRSLEMFQYEREQTELDLEQRVKKRSTPLSVLARTKGKKEAIEMSRRESLNVVRMNNQRVWNNALERPTYGAEESISQKPATGKDRTFSKYAYTRSIKETDKHIRKRDAYFHIRPQTVYSFNNKDNVKLPLLTRGCTELTRSYNKHTPGIDWEYHIARWVTINRKQ